MADTNGNGIKNVMIAALLTGAVAFFTGYGLSNARDAKVIEDHETRLRMLERTNIEMATDVKAIRREIEARIGQR